MYRAIRPYVFPCELRGSTWAVSATGISQDIIFKTLRQMGWISLYIYCTFVIFLIWDVLVGCVLQCPHCVCLDWRSTCSTSKRDRERGAVTIGNNEFEFCTKWREKVRFPLLILAFLCGDYTCHLPFSLMFVRLGGLSPSSASVVLPVSIHLGCSLAPLSSTKWRRKATRKSNGAELFRFDFFSPFLLLINEVLW